MAADFAVAVAAAGTEFGRLKVWHGTEKTEKSCSPKKPMGGEENGLIKSLRPNKSVLSQNPLQYQAEDDVFDGACI